MALSGAIAIACAVKDKALCLVATVVTASG